MKRVTRIIAISSLALLVGTGCTTTSIYSNDPVTGEQKVNNTTKGIGIGAVGGALIGGLTGGSKGAVIGATVGGIGGGLVGNHMDNLDNELRVKLANTGIRVTKYGDRILLTMPSEITFDSNKAVLNPRIYNALDGVALVLNNRDVRVNISGHTDSTGAEDNNERLSYYRAYAVSNYLVRAGVPEDKITARGFGSSMPVADNFDARGRSKNRRVEISITR